MDKKAAMKRIIELTHSENWQEDKEIVAEVQSSANQCGLKSPNGERRENCNLAW